MDLITLEEYKRYTMASENPKDDARIEFLIGSVSALIQAYLGIDTAGGKQYTETLSLDYNTDTLFLEHFPVDQILDVVELGRYTHDSSVHVPLIYASDFSVNTQEGILTRIYTPGGFAAWPVSPGAVTVTYTTAPTWGFGVMTTIPEDLKMAAAELVKYYKSEDYKPSMSVQGSSKVNGGYPSDSDFPKYIQVILDRYR